MMHEFLYVLLYNPGSLSSWPMLMEANMITLIEKNRPRVEPPKSTTYVAGEPEKPSFLVAGLKCF